MCSKSICLVVPELFAHDKQVILRDQARPARTLIRQPCNGARLSQMPTSSQRSAVPSAETMPRPGWRRKGCAAWTDQRQGTAPSPWPWSRRMRKCVRTEIQASSSTHPAATPIPELARHAPPPASTACPRWHQHPSLHSGRFLWLVSVQSRMVGQTPNQSQSLEAVDRVSPTHKKRRCNEKRTQPGRRL